MIDRIFSAALTFGLLAGGTLAIGAALFDLDRPLPSRAAPPLANTAATAPAAAATSAGTRG